MVEEYLEYCESSWGRFRTSAIYNNIHSALTSALTRESFLDIGCGPAHITQNLSALFTSGVAIDSSEDMIRAIPHRSANIQYAVSSFESFTLKEEYDLILCHNVLEYQNDKVSFLTKVARYLRDNNSLLSLVFINRSKQVLQYIVNGHYSEAKQLYEKGLYSSHNFNKTFYLPSTAEIESLLTTCGFQIVVKLGIGMLFPSDYNDANLDYISQWEAGLQDDPKMIHKSTLIQFICRRIPTNLFVDEIVFID